MSRVAVLCRGIRLVALAVPVVLVLGCQRWRPADPAGASAAVPRLPRIPREAARFELDAVDDSTATFRVFEARWLRPGLSAYAVDPVYRDALVARLTILRLDDLTATALVTSQVTRVSRDHVVLVPRPRPRWWRTREIWLSAVAGGVVGAGLTAVVR
jgi:hypothetical protein